VIDRAINREITSKVEGTGKITVDASRAERRGAALACEILDAVDERGSGPRGLDAMMVVAAEMVVACACVIKREAGPDEARRTLKLAGKALAEKR
jgi:hypothetical protein